MKPINKLIKICMAGLVLPMAAHAAPVTWGTAQTVVNNTDIQSAGVTNLAGVKFGATSTATTTVNNGSVNVDFAGMTSTAQVTLSNSLTVASSGYTTFVNTSAPAGVTGAYRTVMTRQAYVSGSATITLGNLNPGTKYQIQTYITGSDSTLNYFSGSPAVATGGGNNPGNNNGYGQWIVGTFTADGVSQVINHTANNNEPVINALTIGTVSGGGPDTTPPDWTATWPQVDPLSTTSLTVRAKTNEAGTAYYVVLPDGATTPTSAQVKAGQDSSNAPVSASGNLALTANVEATGPVGSLSPSTAYDVYFVAQDAVPNLQASPVKVDASTPAPDTTAPGWIATWPQAGQLSATSITVRAKTNETGTAYYVVLADGATAPTAAQVKAGNNSSNAPATASGNLALTANTEATGPVTGLTANTSYDVYFIAEDAVPNLQATPVLVDVTLVTPAVVTWGSSWTDVTDETAIQTPVGYTYGGVNLNGSTTTINNGTQDVVFTGASATDASNVVDAVVTSAAVGPITVSFSGFAFISTGSGNSNVVSAVGSPQTWGTVLDRVIGDDNNSATINLTGLTPGTDYTVQFFSNTPDTNINSTTRITSGGVQSAQFDLDGIHVSGQTRYIIGSFTATGTSQSFSITGVEPTFSALVIGVESSNTFANWISGFSGLNGLTGFNDDADFDGLDNGLENFLGTAPNAGNAGLTAGTLSGSVFTFTHPQNDNPASDVSAPVYTWSTDLVNWNADNTSSGGITVDLNATPNSPSPTTVTATVTGTVPPKLFVRLSVSPN